MAETERAAKIAADFELTLPLLSDLDIDAVWQEATESEKGVLIESLSGACGSSPITWRSK